MKDKESI